MPLRDNSKYILRINKEPEVVYDIRNKIVSSFSDLTFVDLGHKYFLDNGDGTQTELSSVSSISHMFEIPFDAETESIKYAEKHGETPEYWRKQWKYKSTKSCMAGTITHEFGESYMWFTHGHPELITDMCKSMQYDKSNNWLIPVTPKQEAAKAFIDSLPENAYLITNEAKLHSCANKELLNLSTNYAGTTDFLLYYDSPNPNNSGVVVCDWKTNENLYNDFSRGSCKMLKEPFDDLYAESFGNYTIQLNAYQLCIESLDIKVIGRKLIWLKGDGTYDSINVPNVTEKLKEVLR